MVLLQLDVTVLINIFFFSPLKEGGNRTQHLPRARVRVPITRRLGETASQQSCEVRASTVREALRYRHPRYRRRMLSSSSEGDTSEYTCYTILYTLTKYTVFWIIFCSLFYLCCKYGFFLFFGFFSPRFLWRVCTQTTVLQLETRPRCGRQSRERGRRQALPRGAQTCHYPLRVSFSSVLLLVCLRALLS